MRFLITAVLVLGLAGSSFAEGRRYVDPSQGSSWTWRPNNPIRVPYFPPPPNTVRTLTMPDGYTPASRAAIRGEVQTYVPYYGYGPGGYYAPTIIANPYCK
jgi:hypothetical protein